MLISLEKEKKAPVIFLTLTGQTREAILELDLDTLPVDSGVENLIKPLDNLYLKDRDLLAYEAYEAFEKFKRPPSMTINNYIREFKCLKIKNYDMGLSDGMLAYKFLNNANISEHHKQLVQATLNELKYNTMKEQLKKVFSDPSNFTGSIKEEQNVKVEAISNTEDLYYGNRYSK